MQESAPKKDPIPFKVFGLQRVGTNLMVALMTRNFHVHSLEIGAEWKHGPLKNRNRAWHNNPARFVLCVRNPYAWLHSCYRYFRRANGSDTTVAPQFVRDPSVSFEEFALTPTYNFKSPVHRWNEMYRHWVEELPEERTVIVRQDDQLENQLHVLQGIEKKLLVRRKSQELQIIDRRVDIGEELQGSFNRDRQYCVDREYMSEFSPAFLEKVNQLLDPGMLERFNFGRERWTLANRDVRWMALMVRPGTTDAGDAREITFDPYEFDRVKQSNHVVQTYVDIGAHIGSTAMLAKRLWPKCKMLCYEPCPENVRLLRLNMRKFDPVTIVHAAIYEGAEAIVPFLSAIEQEGQRYSTGAGRLDSAGLMQVPALGLEDAVKRFNEIDLLKVGCPYAAHAILDRAIATGILNKIKWVCGRLPPGMEAKQWFSNRLKGIRRIHHLGEPHKNHFLIEPATGGLK